MSKKSNGKNDGQPSKIKPIIKQQSKNLFLRLEDIAAIKYVVEHGGEDAITYIDQTSCGDEYCGKTCTLCGGLVQSNKLPKSNKNIVLNQDVCDKLYEIFCTTEEKFTELLFYLLGYLKDDTFYLQDIKYPYIKDKTECYVTIPIRRMKIYDFFNNLKYKNYGDPVMFLGHTHTSYYSNHFEYNKQSNNFSLVDLLSTSTTQMMVEEGFLHDLSHKKGNRVRFGTIMLNHKGDFSTSWENEDGKLEHFENISFIDRQGEIKDISEYEIDGKRPFGVYRELDTNYNITNRKNQKPLIKNVLDGNGRYCSDSLLEDDGKVYNV